MSKRVFLIVLDSFGIGESSDAYKFKDEGSNTFKACYDTGLLKLPNLKKLGLYNIDGINFGTKTKTVLGSYVRLEEKSASKDTTAGHWEIAGLPTDIPFPTFKKGFPRKIIKKIEQLSGRKVVCNKPYSGTEVIKDYWKSAMKGKLIVYTSADSVLQIAAHEDIVPLKELYDICKKTREIMTGKFCVGRIIARPFVGEKDNFMRTPNRHDYSVDPVGETLLDKLKQKRKKVISIGKISSIFNGKGISKQIDIKSNTDGIEKIINTINNEKFNGLCFANLVDFDSKFGHRNDPKGYALALNEFDKALKTIIESLKEEDTLIITADHGCDPSTKSTDHSREYTPCLMLGNEIDENTNLGTIKGFDFISNTIEKILLRK